jgi:hypothetical protein
MKENKVSFKLTLIIGICCLFWLTGCAARIPNAKYALLQESTSSLLSTVENTYTRIERLQQRFAVTTAPDSAIDRMRFKPKIGGQSYDLTPELQFREAAIEALLNYMNVLQAFSSKDYLTDVDKSTLLLSASLRDLFETSQAINTAEGTQVANIFGGFLNKIGCGMVNHKKREALKQAMDLAQNDIETLSKLIVNSNIKIKKAIDIMLDRILAHANDVRPKYGTVERISFDSEIATLILEADEMEASLEAINAAIIKIPLAHQEIRNDLDKVQSIYNSLQEVVQEAKRAQKFYRSLND